ncbi:uncharacterized protein LOC116294980 [Actinia tenebrosa]|uniref:Uncharacterized protein LOC116294980 n=1 Tax=Actinia tenebrosa TaxID=6105 RepID=A0A6P8I0Y4_ACTTE|nr:uncharacterized protein LOC116294980 [Actinia tenebrosa]
MAGNRFGLSSLDFKRQPLLDIPLHNESFSYDSTPVEDFLADQNPDTLRSLVFKYFIPIAEIQVNVSSEQKSLMKMLGDLYKDPPSNARSLMTSFFGISSPETEDIGEYMIHSGSSREELFLPPYQARNSDESADSEIDVYESADLDVMLLISQPLMCKLPEAMTSDNASPSSNVHLVMDNNGCHLGFTRILVEGNVDVLPEPLKKSVIHCEEGNYLSSEMFLSSIYDPLNSRFQTVEHLKGRKLTRQGPAINMKVLNEDELVKSIFDGDFVPTIKCDGLPDQLLAWQERIQTRPWPPEDIRLQLFQKPCYAVGVGYHGSPGKDMEWRLSASAIESVLGSSLTLVQRKCYILFKMLHKTALKEPKLLATYHLKNILFEALEETEGSASMWTEVNLIPCLYFLLDKLISHLENGRVMSYFIEGYNLIDHYPAENIKEVLEKVKAVRKAPEKYLMMFDAKFAFDFSKGKIFQDDFQPYFQLSKQEKPDNDFQLPAHSIVMSLIRHAHSDISMNELIKYNRAFALLEDAWKIMKVVNPDFNANQFSFMSDVTYSGVEVDQSCKFQEFLRTKYPEAIEANENVKSITSMLGLQLPAQGEASPIFKVLTYRMLVLESFCESKELHASGIQVLNADIYSGTEPTTIAISGTMQRAMLKIALWMTKLYVPAVKSPEELQLRKAAVAMEGMKECLELLSQTTSDSDTGNNTASLPEALTENDEYVPKVTNR